MALMRVSSAQKAADSSCVAEFVFYAKQHASVSDTLGITYVCAKAALSHAQTGNKTAVVDAATEKKS